MTPRQMAQGRLSGLHRRSRHNGEPAGWWPGEHERAAPTDSAISRPVIGRATPPPAPLFQARQQFLTQNPAPAGSGAVNQLRQPAAVVNCAFDRRRYLLLLLRQMARRNSAGAALVPGRFQNGPW